MGTIKNFRTTADVTMNTKLKDGGVYIDWASLTDIRAWIYSDAQKALAGRADVTIDQQDSTKAVLVYAGTKAQYPGINRLIIQARYNGSLKTYDKAVFNFVPRTAEATGNVTIDEPETDVEIVVQDVSSSILDATILAALSAADRANDAAEAAEHMVDIHQGPPGEDGKSPYIGENGHWYEWDEDAGEYVDTETEAQGETGATPDITIGTVTTAEPGTPAAATMTGTPEAPVLNLTIPKGVAGDTPNFTVGEVTTGQPGTPVVVTITGTAAAPVLNVTIPQGLQGNTGSSVDYPYELVNNLTTNDATKGLSAAQGKVLKDEITQLEHKLPMLGGYLVPLLRKVVYKDDDAESLINGINALLNTIELTSITAVYTQPGTIYEGQPLNDLKNGLVVTANYSDGTSAEVNDYELSGTLTAGTSSIVVTYQEETTTFNVTVTDALYYVLGEMMPSKVSARNSVSNSASYNYGVTINGVYYFFTNAYSVSSNATSQKRCCYPAFDLSLTAGKRYKYIIEFTSALSSSQTVQASNAYYDSTYQAAGVANVKQVCDYSSNVQASAWGNTTKSGNTVSFEEVAPSGYVGVRTSLKLLSSGTETTWSLTVKRFIIQEVTE